MWTTWSPLQVNKLTLYVSPFKCASCEEYAPSRGIIQGLKYDKNFCVSRPWSSLYWTVQDPRAASNSSALSDAIAKSTCHYSMQEQKTQNQYLSSYPKYFLIFLYHYCLRIYCQLHIMYMKIIWTTIGDKFSTIS